MPTDYCVNNKFRDKELHAELYDKVKAGMAPFLTTKALKMCYHPFCTQKNESLNRKSTATAPKDRFYGGINTLADRLRMVAIEDSVGYTEGVTRVFSSMGIPLCDTVREWWRRKDHKGSRKKAYRERIDIKIQRAQKTRADWNTG